MSARIWPLLARSVLRRILVELVEVGGRALSSMSLRIGRLRDDSPVFDRHKAPKEV